MGFRERDTTDYPIGRNSEDPTGKVSSKREAGPKLTLACTLRDRNRNHSEQERDACRTAYGRVLPGRCQQTGIPMNPECGDGIAAPVAGVEETSAGINPALIGIITQR